MSLSLSSHEAIHKAVQKYFRFSTDLYYTSRYVDLLKSILADYIADFDTQPIQFVAIAQFSIEPLMLYRLKSGWIITLSLPLFAGILNGPITVQSSKLELTRPFNAQQRFNEIQVNPSTSKSKYSAMELGNYKFACSSSTGDHLKFEINHDDYVRCCLIARVVLIVRLFINSCKNYNGTEKMRPLEMAKQ